MANTLATAATAPFAGAISDLIGRRSVALLGLCLIIVGMLVAGMANHVGVLIGGSALQGVGAGLAELIASAGVMELVPVRDRGKYVGLFYIMFLPICGCGAYGWFLLIIFLTQAQLFSRHSWRWGPWISIIIAGINFILLVIFYRPPPRQNSLGLTKREVLGRVDFVGGALSIAGMSLFLMGLQWAGYT